MTEQKNPLRLVDDMDAQEAPQEDTGKGVSFVLQMIEKNRVKGLETLERKVANLQDRELHSDAETEKALRDVQAGLAAAMQVIEAQNSLVDMMFKQMLDLGESADVGRAHSLSNSAHIQNIKECSVNKGLLTDEELLKNWKEKMVPQLEKIGLKEPGPSPQD